jgi:hypothetical protein
MPFSLNSPLRQPSQSFTDSGALKSPGAQLPFAQALQASAQADDKPFRLADSFLQRYEGRSAPFGFEGLGEFVYLRTYSRVKADGTNEVW